MSAFYMEGEMERFINELQLPPYVAITRNLISIKVSYTKKRAKYSPFLSPAGVPVSIHPYFFQFQKIAAKLLKIRSPRIMCTYDVAPVRMVCGHPGPESLSPIHECKKNPCETGGVPKPNYLGSTKKRHPCDDCISNGTWWRVEGTRNTWTDGQDRLYR
ncbi:hypothetical protein MferCBS31731_003349 [Microsporum ferrugineum]